MGSSRNGNEDDWLETGGGETARSEEVWSSSGELVTIGDANIEDELDQVFGDINGVDERDRKCTDDLETVRCQSVFSPDGLFRTVGRASSRFSNAFVRLRRLYGVDKQQHK
jgi:hypothetical protein